MGNRYHLTASEGVGLVSEKGEKQEEFLSRFVYPLIGFVTVAAFWAYCLRGRSLIRAGLEVVYPDIGVLVRWFLPRGLSDERDMARYI